MKSVLLTGIAGLLGQNLSRVFLRNGWKVYGLDDLSIGRREWLPSGVTFDKYNICDPLGAKQSFYNIKFDLIIHLASRKIPRYDSASTVLTENTQGLSNVLQCALLAKSKFIFLSTSEVCGKNDDQKETADSIIGHPTVSRWSYAITKMWGEQLLHSTPEEFNFNIVRLFNTYGPYYDLSWHAGPFSVFISQALKKQPMTIHGDGMQKRAFQYIDDAVDGIMKIVESDCKREVFNIGNPDTSIKIKNLARKIWIAVNPTLPVELTMTKHSPFKYEELQNRVPDISKAKRLLGFEPKIGLDEGLAKTIEWQKGVV